MRLMKQPPPIFYQSTNLQRSTKRNTLYNQNKNCFLKMSLLTQTNIFILLSSISIAKG